MSPSLSRDGFGRLVFTDAEGAEHVGVLPVRAFALSAPGEGLSLLDARGRELAWLASPDALAPAARALVDEELRRREFVPEIRRLRAVSSFATPSTWQIDTDRGPTQLVLKGEEDIRRLGDGELLVADRHGLHFRVRDFAALDRHSRRLLERFL
jgi:hypothetical protein